MADGKVVRLPIRGGGPSDPPGGLSTRVTRVEARIDEIARRLDAIEGRLTSLDANLSRLPSKEFLATTVVAVGGISLAAALAFAALTFNIADYAAKNAPRPEEPRATTAPASQPVVVVVPSPAGPQPQAVPQPAPPTQKQPQ